MNGVELIAAERKRQVESEGWTPEHDDTHSQGEMAAAAVCYASQVPLQARMFREVWGDEDCGCREVDCPHRFILPEYREVWCDPWPWDAECDKRLKHDRLRQLVIAGALIAAEIDRLQRAEKSEGTQ